MLPSLPGSAWKTVWNASYSAAWASPSALASLAPSAVTAVENAGSSPGRPGGQTSQSASSTLRTARPAILRQKLISLWAAIRLRRFPDNLDQRLSFGQALRLLDRSRRHLHGRQRARRRRIGGLPEAAVGVIGL